MKKRIMTAKETEILHISKMLVSSKLEMKTNIYKILVDVLNTGRRAEMNERNGLPKKSDEELLSGYTRDITEIFIHTTYVL